MLLKKIDKKICCLKGKLAFKENAKKIWNIMKDLSGKLKSLDSNLSRKIPFDKREVADTRQIFYHIRS